MGKLDPKKVLKPISWLIGKWNSVEACGEYPGFPDFEYCDFMEFKYFGQPLLQYTSRTYLKDENNTPKHYECGYMKVKPCTSQLCFMVAHNFGLTSVEEGEVCGKTFKLQTTEISKMSFGIKPAVCELRRKYELRDDGKLQFIMHMATDKKPLTKHLMVLYEREC